MNNKTAADYESDPFAFLPECDLDSPAALSPVSAPHVGGYRESCIKCNGTGKFISYSGRVVGSCYTCKGAGFKTYTTSPEQRAYVRTQTAATKARNAGTLLATFESNHPHIATWWNNTTFGFAIAMRDTVARYGDLTPKQYAACCKCATSTAERATAKQAAIDTAQPLDTSALSAAFAHAGNGEKLKLRFAGFSVYPAKASSVNAGALYVKNGATYLGKIVQGKFMASRECNGAVESEFRAACADPKAAAVAYGRKFGACSCCGRTLTNKESIALGIGPICAARFGW